MSGLTLHCSACCGRVGQTYDSEHRGLQCVDCGSVFPVDNCLGRCHCGEPLPCQICTIKIEPGHGCSECERSNGFLDKVFAGGNGTADRVGWLAQEHCRVVADLLKAEKAPDREKVASMLWHFWGYWMAFMCSRWYKHEPSRLEIPPEILQRWLHQSLHDYNELPDDIDPEDPDGKRVSKEMFRHWADELIGGLAGKSPDDTRPVGDCPTCAQGDDCKEFHARGHERCASYAGEENE